MSCDIYEGHTITGTATAGAFALAIFLSYVPQQVTIVRRQTIEGINPYFLMLMNLGSTFAFSNILMLSQPLAACCRSSISNFDCLGSSMSLAQLFSGFAGPAILLMLAVRFRGPGAQGEGVLRSARIVLAVDTVLLIIICTVIDPVWRHQFATAFGLAALCVGLVQYLPQMLTTYRLKHTGSLSVLTMLMQIPGGYLWCLSLAMRKDSHWSTWISLFAAATFQLVLLIMAMYYSSMTTAKLAERLTTPPPSPGRSANTDQARPSEGTPLLSESA